MLGVTTGLCDCRAMGSDKAFSMRLATFSISAISATSDSTTVNSSPPSLAISVPSSASSEFSALLSVK